MTIAVIPALLIIASAEPPVASYAAELARQDGMASQGAAASILQIQVPTPEGTNRVTAAAMFQPPNAGPGETVTLFVKVRVAPGHWIYGLEESESHNIPTSLTVEGREGVLRPAAPWGSSAPKVKAGAKIHSGEAVFERRFTIDRAAAPGMEKLRVILKHQVCNEALCWPPRTISLAPCLTILK